MHFKVSFNGDIRRFQLEATSDDIYAVLCTMLAGMYDIKDTSDLRVQYKDDEGDLITISSTAEFKEAIFLSKNSDSSALPTIRLFLTRLSEASPDPAASSSATPVVQQHSGETAESTPRIAAVRAEEDGVRAAQEALATATGAARKAREEAQAAAEQAAESSRIAARQAQDAARSAAGNAAAGANPASATPNTANQGVPPVTGIPELDTFLRSGFASTDNMGNTGAGMNLVSNMLGMIASGLQTAASASAASSSGGFPPMSGQSTPGFFNFAHPPPPGQQQQRWNHNTGMGASTSFRGPGAHGDHRGSPAGTRRGMGGSRPHGGGGGPRRSCFGGMWDESAGRFPWVLDTCNMISEETKGAFRELMNTIRSSGEAFAVMAGLRAAFPSIRGWVMQEIGESGAVAVEKINELIDKVSPLLRRHISEALVGNMTGCIRTALADSGVLTLLRRIRSSDILDGVDIDLDISRMFEGAGMGQHMAPTTFDTHVGVECDGCGTDPIVGTRFHSTTRENYDLCGVCNASGEAVQEGEAFTDISYPWEASNNSVVPPCPLSFQDRSPHVAHLQKLLTELGYMTESMYSRRVGFFGPNTRAALQQFQREYGLDSAAQLGVYDELTRAALFSIIDSGTPPSSGAAGASGSGVAASGTAAETSSSA